MPIIFARACACWSLRERFDVTSLECQAHFIERCLCMSAPTTLSILREAIGRRKGIFRDALLATFIINTLTLATALFSLQVYDRVIPHSGFQTLAVLATGVAMAIGLELLLKHVRSVLMDRDATRIDTELSEWFFERALGIRMEARPNSLGTFASQVKGLEYLRGVIGSTTLFVLADVPFALFFIVVIWVLGGPLAWVPLLMLPPSLAAGLVFQRRIARATAASQAQGNQKAGMLVESIDGIESIKANGSQAQMRSRWREIVAEAGEADESTKYFSAFSANVTAALQQLAHITLIAFGAYLVVEGRLTMGGLIACSIISSRTFAPIGRLPGILVQWAHARAALVNLDQLLEQPNELDEVAHQLSPGTLEGALRLEDVRFFYAGNERAGLDLPALSIRPGERVGVVGAIGSGKSTLLKLVSGLYRPREGRVFLGGVDMAMVTPSRLRELIAYVPQESRPIRGTLRENLIQGVADPGDDALLAAARETGLLDLINSHPLGLALPISEGGRGISGGQRQLIALTRLLLIQPVVLLLDEPTASMDAATEARVVALLEKRAAEGTTLLIATHKTALMPMLDRLLVFQGGRLLMDGPRDSVLQKLTTKTPAPSALQQVPA